jgi:hypothetical protein
MVMIPAILQATPQAADREVRNREAGRQIGRGGEKGQPGFEGRVIPLSPRATALHHHYAFDNTGK